MAPIPGREISSVDSEARWIRARATAEAIKSECFRFAPQLGDYAGASARAALIARRHTLSDQAERAGLTPLPDPVPSSGDARRPPFPLTMPWYIEHRLDAQMRYYANGQTENEEGVRRYRVAGFAAAVIAAILGVAASNFGQGWFAPWVGVMTTLAAAATAYGLLDRRQYLAGAYGAMVTRLSRVKELFADGTGNLPALVTATEDLLQSEHGAWVERTTQTITAPHPAASAGAR